MVRSLDFTGFSEAEIWKLTARFWDGIEKKPKKTIPKLCKEFEPSVWPLAGGAAEVGWLTISKIERSS